jgi:two-component system chemotaxis sensor kinase CheA
LGDVLAPVVTSGMELARERGKQLEEITLDHLEFFLDPKVMQKIRGAVIHAIRNAVDHGLEPSETRLAAGKTPCCRVAISAQDQNGWIELSIQDDGRGIDIAKVKDIAVKKGLITAQQAPLISQEEVYELLFLPGFSTAASVTSVSGRGVGMDAIREIARELGGEVKLSSKFGQGTKIVIRFPANATLPEAPVRNLSREIRIKATGQFPAVAN